MTHSQFCSLVQENIPDLLDRSGRFLFTSLRNLSSTKLCLIGDNPGGDPNKYGFDKPEHSLKGDLHAMGTKPAGWCSYIDEATEWDGHRARRIAGPIKEIVEGLGYEWSEVTSTNLVFVRSSHRGSLSHTLKGKCWPIHRALIQECRPRLIVAYGNGDNGSAFAFLRMALEAGDVPVKTRSTGIGQCRWKACRVNIEDHSTLLVGVPHPCRPGIGDANELCRWVRGLCASE